MEEKLLKIISTYGVNNQQRKLNEEVFELQEAISIYEKIEYWDSEGFFVDFNPDKDAIIEEIADVTVMLLQFKEYYHIDGKEILDIMNMKIERQLNRITNE